MDPHLYATLLFLHILCAIIWVGGGITLHLYALQAMKGDTTEKINFMKHAEMIGKKVFAPASGVLLVLGVWMVLADPRWGLTDTWVLIGFAGIIVSAGLGSAVIGPSAGKMAALLQEKGAEDPEVVALSKKIMLLSRVDIAILIVVVWDMAYKPFS